MSARISTFFGTHRQTIGHWVLEILVVVLGVTIAFGLQSWSDDVASKKRAAQAEDRIRAELLENMTIFVERIAVYPCLHGQLQRLSSGLSSGGMNWRPPGIDAGQRELALKAVYILPSRGMLTDAYQGALGGRELDGVTAARRAQLANIYAMIRQFDPLNDEENQLATRLVPPQFGMGLGESARPGMLATVARLDDLNSLLRLIASQFFEALAPAGLRPGEEDLRALRHPDGWATHVRGLRAKYGDCVNADAVKVVDPGYPG